MFHHVYWHILCHIYLCISSHGGNWICYYCTIGPSKPSYNASILSESLWDIPSGYIIQFLALPHAPSWLYCCKVHFKSKSYWILMLKQIYQLIPAAMLNFYWWKNIWVHYIWHPVHYFFWVHINWNGFVLKTLTPTPIFSVFQGHISVYWSNILFSGIEYECLIFFIELWHGEYISSLLG